MAGAGIESWRSRHRIPASCTARSVTRMPPCLVGCLCRTATARWRFPCPRTTGSCWSGPKAGRCLKDAMDPDFRSFVTMRLCARAWTCLQPGRRLGDGTPSPSIPRASIVSTSTHTPMRGGANAMAGCCLRSAPDAAGWRLATPGIAWTATVSRWTSSGWIRTTTEPASS